MQQPAAKMDKVSMVRASSAAKHLCDDLMKRARDIAHDTRKIDRLGAQECKACFYFGKLGGSAITDRPCMCCGEKVSYASTATGKLCKSCALENKLCRHCGGDIDMRPQRKKWPEPKLDRH